jgi:hypothetical protein
MEDHMKPSTILLLQSLLIALQMANAAIDTLPQPWPVVAAAIVGGFQFYVNHLGNITVPEVKPVL